MCPRALRPALEGDMSAELASTLTAVAMGVGLSAACGFRVFLPLLFTSVAVHFGYVHTGAAWQWIGGIPAIVTLATATVIEIGGYYIPWIDHALDTVAAPAALIAGTLVTGSLIVDMDPLMKWTLAAIAGGGAAGVVQALTMTARGASTATTGGLANPIVATVEVFGAVFLALLALIVPVVAVIAFLLVIFLIARMLLRLSRRRKAASVSQGPITG